MLREYQQIIDELSAEDPHSKADIRLWISAIWNDTYVHEAMDTDLDDPVVKAAERAIEAVTWGESRAAVLYRLDGRRAAQLLRESPDHRFRTGRMESAHSDNEHIDLAEIVPAVLIYSWLACDFCGLSGV